MIEFPERLLSKSDSSKEMNDHSRKDLDLEFHQRPTLKKGRSQGKSSPLKETSKKQRISSRIRTREPIDVSNTNSRPKTKGKGALNSRSANGSRTYKSRPTDSCNEYKIERTNVPTIIITTRKIESRTSPTMKTKDCSQIRGEYYRSGSGAGSASRRLLLVKAKSLSVLELD